jgi:hypothetical protein
VTKKNYLAWHIRSEDFSDGWDDLKKLKFFAGYAILAPSGHNTQPWRFSSDKQTLLLEANRDRRLPYSGVQANEPYVSLGACLQTLELAAKGFGYKVRIDYLNDDQAVAKVSLGGKAVADPSLLEAITHRVSNRHPYDTAKPSEELLESFVGTDLEHVAAHLLSDRKDIEYIAAQTAGATLRTFTDKEFRNELSKWVRNNVTRQHDGMPGFVQGIPTPPSMLAKHIIKRLNISKDQAKKDAGRVQKSAALIIPLASEETPQALLNGGRLYAQICILAQRAGIATSGTGAAVVDPVSREEIVKKYKLRGTPIAIIRLGKAKKPARHTPRWPLSQVYED